MRRATFVTAAGILAIVGVLAAGYYFATRPEVLRIAVGPANSDDVKVVQTLTQAFAQHRSYVRLKPVQTDGAVASAEALAENKVDLAIIRGDLDVPRNAQAVATLRKNYVVLWVPPPAKGKGKKTGPKITKISQLAGRKVGVVGKTQANVNVLKLILLQYGVDPAKVEIVQFPAGEAAEAIRKQAADVYLAAGPVNSKITTDAIAASAKDGGEPTFLAIDASEAIATNHPAYEAVEIPSGTFGSPDRPEEEVQDHQLLPPHRGAERPVGDHRRRIHAPAVLDPPATADGVPAGRENRDARHRQGRRDSRASRRRRLCRRRGKDIYGPLQRLHLVGPDGAVGDGLGRRLVRRLCPKRTSAATIPTCASGCWR